VNLDDRKAFAAALWDVPESEAVVLLASTESASILLRDAPPLDALPDVVTPWTRARVWATAHRDALVAPPLSIAALEREIAAKAAAGLVLVDPSATASFLTRGSLARAFVFAPRGRKTKLRVDRVQNAFVRGNGKSLAERDNAIVDAALAVLGPEPLSFKEVLRLAREKVKASSDDGKKIGSAFLRAWEDSDLELFVQKPPK